MITQKPKRKLTAILSADAKGYSRLMREDEVATVETLKAYREIIASFIKQHRGRVVDSPGDNVLAEFASVVDAVECAVEIQGDLQTRNARLPENRRMEFRIGINLGDVIKEGNRIYGDGVNIAARVEGLAEGGGICVSGTVYEHVKNKLTFGYESLGEHTVKNIGEPVRIYRLLKETETAKPKVLRKHELPDKPSIAVLPFVNISGDPKQEYLSDGITEQIITALSKVSEMFVIARNSVFAYKGRPVKVQQVSEELGVRYVLEGSVQKEGNQLRITAQLVDALTGHHLWAERYDRDVKDIFALQDELAKKILEAMQVKLTEGAQARLWGKGTQSLDAYLTFLQGVEAIHRLNPDDNALARQLSEEAISLDPEYAGPYLILGYTHLSDIFFGLSRSPDESLKQAEQLAQKALALDPYVVHTHLLLGRAYLLRRQYEQSIAEIEKAIEAGPNEADAYVNLGATLNFAGRPEEAIPLVQKAIRLNPFPPTWYFLTLGHAYQQTGRYEEAIELYKISVQREPNNLFSHVRLSDTYILSGSEEEARAEAREVLQINPKFSIEGYAKNLPYKNGEETERLREALRKAGLPD